MPISCHFRDCKAFLSMRSSWSNAISSTGPLPLHAQGSFYSENQRVCTRFSRQSSSQLPPIVWRQICLTTNGKQTDISSVRRQPVERAVILHHPSTATLGLQAAWKTFLFRYLSPGLLIRHWTHYYSLSFTRTSYVSQITLFLLIT